MKYLLITSEPASVSALAGVLVIQLQLAHLHSHFLLCHLGEGTRLVVYAHCHVGTHQYFRTLRNSLDKHAPIHGHKTPQHVNKWFINSKIWGAKRRKHKLENEWQRDNSAINRSRYRATVNHFNHFLECSKTKYCSNTVRENEDNPKTLSNSINKVLHRSPKIVLRVYTTIISLTNTFGKYFADKLSKLTTGLKSTNADPPATGSYKNKFVSFWTM